MFLRPNHRGQDGKDHTYWSLVETVRTPDGPRQKTLCYLGELNSSAHARWLTTVEVFNEQGETQQLKLFPSHVEPPPDDPQVARVVLNKVRLERTRQFGACFLGLELWKRLELDRFFEQAVDGEAADVPWSRVAALLAINRLCAPGSELAIEQRWYPSTAMDDLLDIDEGKVNDTRLYRCLDRILPHKTKLERHLKNRYGELFGAEFDVLLYDLTSTYVEGAAEKNPMVRRGYSRDHRPDCEQLVIALIVNNEGFPFSYETFDGNRTDVSTMETILRMVERKYGKARRIWVFDRGIVSEENLAAIRKRGGQYLTGTPRSQMKQFEAELLKEDWTRVRPEVEVRKVAIPQGEETYILCRTAGRKEKEKAIRNRFSNSMEKALRGLQKTIAAGRLKDRNKMERRLGKIQARHPQVNDLYDVALKDTPEGVRLFWQIKEDRKNWRESRVSAAHEFASGNGGRVVGQVYAVDGGGGILSRIEERAFDSALVPPIGAARQGSRDGGVLGLCVMGNTQASAEAPADACSQAVGERSRACPADDAHAGDRAAVHVAKRRHRASYDRRSGDPLAPDHRADDGAEITAPPTRHQPARTPPIQPRM